METIMSNVKTAKITCVVADEDKEKAGSFRVQLFHEGELLYQRERWGLAEQWLDGTTHSTTSRNLGVDNFPARGTYVLKGFIDSGKNVDVNTYWSIEILTTDQKTIVSEPFRQDFSDDLREFEITYVI